MPFDLESRQRRNEGRDGTRTAGQRGRTSRIRSQLQRTQGLRQQESLLKPEPILYVGLNEGTSSEAAVLQRANKDKGGVALVTDAKQPDRVRQGGKDYDLSNRDGIVAYTNAIGISNDQQQEVVALIEAQGHDARDEVAKIVAIYFEAEKGHRTLNRVVLSGHSVGGVIWGDGNGTIYFSTFIELARLFPKAAGQVEDVMLSACYTGGERDIHDYYLKMFPNLKTVWAYAGSSPGTWTGAVQHLKIWEKTSEGQNFKEAMKRRSVASIELFVCLVGFGCHGAAVAKTRPPDGMVFVENGCYRVGCDKMSNRCDSSFRPQTRVCSKAFFMDKTEVTRAAYAECVKSGACQAHEVDLRGDPSLPVVGVTWSEANAYCKWMKKRLPSETEWEAAARGVEGRLYPWGDSEVDGSKVVTRRDAPTAVCSKPEGNTPSGICDLSGNVAEWTADRFGRKRHRVIKGGAFVGNDLLLKPWSRYHVFEDQRLPFVGFRCARSAE